MTTLLTLFLLALCGFGLHRLLRALTNSEFYQTAGHSRKNRYKL